MRFFVICRKRGPIEMKVKTVGVRSMSSAIWFTANASIGCRGSGNLARLRRLSTLILVDTCERFKASRWDEFARLRSENLGELRALNLREEDLAMRAEHPVLGVVTLSELLATWAAHDLTHLHQISRVMAHQYRDAVGPFSRNLGVLRCAGHSSPE
jgi:hypothetical protein